MTDQRPLDQDLDDLSRDDLVGLVEDLRGLVVEAVAANEALRADNEALRGRVAELERELGRNSDNAGLAPSSDGHADKSSRRSRRKVAKPKRKPGKQEGAPGRTLDRVAEPDETVDHVPDACDGCGHELTAADTTSIATRQVFDVPDPTLAVTEHRAATRRCGDCGFSTAASFPAEATGQACWGPNVKAQALFLMSANFIPYARCAELLAVLCGAAVSTGALAYWQIEAAGRLDGFDEAVRALMALAPVVHADETTIRVREPEAAETDAAETDAGLGGTRRSRRRTRRESAARRKARRARIRHKRYVHVASTERLTHLASHSGRGSEAMTEIGVLPDVTGVLVSDGYKQYWLLDGLEHACCNAHIIRNLDAVAELAGQADWADDMIDLLLETRDAVDAVRQRRPNAKALSKPKLAALKKRYGEIVAAGYAANPEPDGRKRDKLERESYNLAARLELRRDDVLRFARDFQVPFTNNLAERDLRSCKLHDKISGTYRSVEHADAALRLRSYISTLAKNGQNILAALKAALLGDAWIPTHA